MKKHTSEHGLVHYSEVQPDDEFSLSLFNFVSESYRDDIQVALHTNLGSLTVLERLTGFGCVDVETGYRDTKGNFWLATGGIDVRESPATTIQEAIDWVKSKANLCKPNKEELCQN